jgi:CheY-like chemotaxis protein
MARVLVINDDESILDVYEQLLRDLGHEAVPRLKADSGPEVVREVEADALIIDLQRPEEAEYGLRIIEELRGDAHRGDIPIVLATGVSELPKAERLQTLAVEVVRKPFEISEMEDALRRSLHDAQGFGAHDATAGEPPRH